MLSAQEIDHLARLARLRLSPEERERLARELGSILDYVAKLAELDLSAVPPMSHVGESGTPLRKDEAVPSPDGEAALAAAPARNGRFVSVPRVIG